MNCRNTVLAMSLVFTATLIFGVESKIPSSLRGGIKVDRETINVALEIQKHGWIYVMPRPKSKKARWGNTDGRTTWWIGYWQNNKMNQYSSTTPKLKGGVYVGDGKGGYGWRRGGSPRAPTKLEWLLSKSGGIPPKD